MIKTFLIAVALSTAICSSAQTIPSPVKAAFIKSFPNTTVKNWEKEDDGYEANFSKDGKTMSATFDAKGNWMETETDIKVSDLPAAVTSYIKARYKDAIIKEASTISNPQSKKMYEAEVNGKDLLFDENGKFMKSEKDYSLLYD